MGCMYPFELLFLDKYPVVYNYYSCIFSFLRNLQVFPSGCAIYIPTNSAWGVSLLHILAHTCSLVLIFNKSDSDECFLW